MVPVRLFFTTYYVTAYRPPHFGDKVGGQKWWWILKGRTVGAVGENKRCFCFRNCRNQLLVICEKRERSTFQEKTKIFDSRKSCKESSVKSRKAHLGQCKFFWKRKLMAANFPVSAVAKRRLCVCLRLQRLKRVLQRDADMMKRHFGC